ncbi:MAG TPA: hypothetical protein PLQ05_02175 [Acidobacteriota bacterium]|nr:hypothetical protein [Acidobacteriota bacterium]HQO18809.1 hypothetical protein [Acidobacteriota bacterium]
MRLPSLVSSGAKLLETFGLYHLTRLKADKTLKEMADAFEKAQGRLKQRIEAYKAAEASAMTAMAIRDGEDDAFDEAIGQLALDVLKATGNSKKSALYLKYFPDGMTAIVNAPLEAELQKAGVILAKLAEEEDPAITAHAGPIRTALEALATAIDTHKSAMEVEMQTYGMLQTEKVNWLDTYKKDYRDLTRLFYKAPKKAEGYFKPASKGDKADKEAKKEPETPATPKV